MTLRQYLYHLRQWLRMFPLPKEEDHMFIGLVGEREQRCPCGATQMDDLTLEELGRDRLMNAEWQKIHDKFYPDESS